MKDGTKKRKVIFSDETIFTVEAKVNSQNDRVLAKKAKDILENLKNIYHRQKPVFVMIWAAVSKTWKSPLIFVKPGTKINTECYIKEILSPALIEMKKHFKTKVFTFQQDCARSHTLKKLNHRAEKAFPHFGIKKYGFLSPHLTLAFSQCSKKTHAAQKNVLSTT